MNLKGVLTAAPKVIKRGLVKHSPEILLGTGIVSAAASIIFAVKATPKALKSVEEAHAETVKEKVKAGGKYYIPSAVLFAFAVLCLVSGNRVSSKRNAAIAAAAAVTEQALRQYKDAVVENVAPEIQEKIEDTVAAKQIQRAPDPRDCYIYNLNPDGVLFLEPLTGQPFRSDKETIRAAANTIKQKMLNDGFSGTAELGDFFDELGLNIPSDIKHGVGWNISGNCLDDISFSAQIAANGDPCLVLKYNKPPIYNFDKWDNRPII